MKILKITNRLTASVLGISLIAGPQAMGMGKSPASPTTPTSSTPQYTVANPFRPVVVQPFLGIAAFTGPTGINNSDLDLATALNGLVGSELTMQTILRATSSAPQGCTRHLEMKATVSDFEMTDSFNFNFGFGSAGGIPVTTPVSVTANDTFVIKSIIIDFELMSCPSTAGDLNPCADVVTAQATDKVLGNEATFTVGSGPFTGGGDIITNQALMGAVDKIIASGMQQIEAQIPAADLPWSASIELDNSGNIFINEGSLSGIKQTDFFAVYSAAGLSDVCQIFDPIACVAATANGLGVPSTQVQVIDTLNKGLSIQSGDIVQMGNAQQCGLTSGQVAGQVE